MQYSLDSQYQYVAAVAHLNDTLRGVEDTNLFYQGCEIAKYEDTYTLYYSGQNCHCPQYGSADSRSSRYTAIFLFSD